MTGAFVLVLDPFSFPFALVVFFLVALAPIRKLEVFSLKCSIDSNNNRNTQNEPSVLFLRFVVIVILP